MSRAHSSAHLAIARTPGWRTISVTRVVSEFLLDFMPGLSLSTGCPEQFMNCPSRNQDCLADGIVKGSTVVHSNRAGLYTESLGAPGKSSVVRV